MGLAHRDHIKDSGEGAGRDANNGKDLELSLLVLDHSEGQKSKSEHHDIRGISQAVSVNYHLVSLTLAVAELVDDREM